LSEFERLDLPITPHPVLGSFTRSVNTIQGGVKVNVVPDRCAVAVDMRTVPGQDHKAMLHQLENLAADLERRIPGFKASVRLVSDLPAVETLPAEPVVQNFIEAATQVMGKSPEPETVRFATEAAIFVPALRVPCIIFGPGNAALAHQPDEFTEIDELVQAAHVYAAAAVKLLT